MILPFCLHKGFKYIKTKKIHLHILRSILSLGGSVSFFYAIKYIELVDATAVGYLEQVLWAIIGMVFFAERITLTKIISVILSFLGALIIMYPEVIIHNQNGIFILSDNLSFGGFNIYYIFVFLSIILWASNCTVVKLLSKTESNKTQLFYVMMLTTLFAFPVAFFQWQGVEGMSFLHWTVRSYSFDELGLKLQHITIILILALCYFIHSITFFKALKLAELSIVVPFDYSRLVFTGIIGFVFFNEYPQFGAMVGFFLIIISGIFLIRSETLHNKDKNKKQELQVEFENT
jgi:S-adenosylmethionine uptake transporter